MTQTDQIKTHLESGNSLTAIEALNKFGCFRLAARIRDLRQSGMEIHTQTVSQNGKKYARYYL